MNVNKWINGACAIRLEMFEPIYEFFQNFTYLKPYVNTKGTAHTQTGDDYAKTASILPENLGKRT